MQGQADGLLEAARDALAGMDPQSTQRQSLREAARLLAQLLLQDVYRRASSTGLNVFLGEPKLKPR